MLGDMQDQPRLLEDLRDSSVPVVATWQGTSPLEFPTVDVDERAGIVAGLEHLIGLGHRRIGFVSGRLPGDNWQRQNAFTEVVTDRLGSVPDGYLQVVDNSLSGGEAALTALLALAEPPTAIVTSTDLVAVGVLHAAYSLSRIVPDELSVVGFDDLLLAAHTVPALTTVRMPIAEIVRESVELAIALARDPSASRAPRVRVYEPTLVIRQSTAPPPAAPTGRPEPRPQVSSRRPRDPDPHRLDRPVRPGEVGDRGELDRAVVARLRVGHRGGRHADGRRRQVRARDRGHRGRRIDLDVLESHPVRQVDGLDAVDERTALEGDAAADGVDVSVGFGRPDGEVELEGQGVAGLPPPRLVDAPGVGRHGRGVAVRVAQRRRSAPGGDPQRQRPRLRPASRGSSR